MKPEWRSDPNKPIELHDTCSSDFEAYSQWLYTRLLPSEDSYRRFSALSGLYVLGERLMDDTFQQIIIDHMILRAGNTGAKLDRCPALETINIIYKGTSTNSPARRLVSDMWAHGALNPTFNLLSQLDPERDGELMRDMLQTLAKYHPMTTLGRPLPWQTQRERYRCDYVEQVDGDDRLAKKPKLDRQTCTYICIVIYLLRT